jgi:hypothetical protein
MSRFLSLPVLLFEVLIRVAIMQIKIYVHRNARGKVITKNPNRQAIRLFFQKNFNLGSRKGKDLMD